MNKTCGSRRGSNSHTQQRAVELQRRTRIHTYYMRREIEKYIYTLLRHFLHLKLEKNGRSEKLFFKGPPACAERRREFRMTESEGKYFVCYARSKKSTALCRRWRGGSRSDDAGPLVCDSSYLLSLYVCVCIDYCVRGASELACQRPSKVIDSSAQPILITDVINYCLSYLWAYRILE
jgi:hypothetical protein